MLNENKFIFRVWYLTFECKNPISKFKCLGSELKCTRLKYNWASLVKLSPAKLWNGNVSVRYRVKEKNNLTFKTPFDRDRQYFNHAASIICYIQLYFYTCSYMCVSYWPTKYFIEHHDLFWYYLMKRNQSAGIKYSSSYDVEDFKFK